RMQFALAGNRRLRVVVAMDRSHASDAPIAWVKTLRERLPCDIFVHHFYMPDIEHRRFGIPVSVEPFVPNSQVTAALERELRQRFAGLGGEGELSVRCEPHFGSISVEALCSARVDGADVIVVGTHRRRGVSRFLHGSVSRDIIRHSDVPVVCVGPDTLPRPATKKIHKVLVATDLSELGNRAIGYAYDLLAEGTGAVDIVYVAGAAADVLSTSPPGDAGRLTPAQKQHLIGKLERLVPPQIDPMTVTTRCFVVDGGPVTDAILQAAARWNADAICLASRGRSPIERAFAGSVATEVTQGAQCPVLVVRDVAV
ncbi:MAG TPA: universal stress protein, partial [Myxococcota bacterium]|nr:universal stress protein [Myxococcota bacterium]